MLNEAIFLSFYPSLQELCWQEVSNFHITWSQVFKDSKNIDLNPKSSRRPDLHWENTQKRTENGKMWLSTRVFKISGERNSAIFPSKVLGFLEILKTLNLPQNLQGDQIYVWRIHQNMIKYKTLTVVKCETYFCLMSERKWPKIDTHDPY